MLGLRPRHSIKLFNPTRSVRDRLALVNSITELDIATLQEMMALLAKADGRHAWQAEAKLIGVSDGMFALSSGRKQEELSL
jgi:hypothetical protein